MPQEGSLYQFVTQNRLLNTGDSVNHPLLGSGEAINGWDGHLEVKFASENRVFTDASNLSLIPDTSLVGHTRWFLVDLDFVQALGFIPYGELHLLFECLTRVSRDLKKDEYSRQLLVAWEEIKREKEGVLAELDRQMQCNFIALDRFYAERAIRYLSENEFAQKKADFVRDWINKTFLKNPNGSPVKIPDEEQALAIASVSDHVLVAARAGSGKTETVANRAAFLQKHCAASPGEMLLLAFNRDAAAEMAERLKSKLSGLPLPHVMTFHALAFALVPGAKQILVNQSNGADQSLNQEFQRVLMDTLADLEFEARVRRLMLAHFRNDWERVVRGGYNLDPEEMLQYRRNLASETLRGEYVKSFGEKVIANFLFEHDIPYRYEQSHWWSGFNYRPDFTIPKSGSMTKPVVIEYFGLLGDPEYDDACEQKRDYWAGKSNEWILIELTPEHLYGGVKEFERQLAELLKPAIVPTRRLSEEDIWLRIRDRVILGFTEAMTGFVGRCRKHWISPDRLAEMIAAHHPLSEIEGWFIEIALELYEAYLSRLAAIDADDFDGLMQRAVTLIESGVSKFSRKGATGDLRQIRYLFVDEYQDFTELFHRMVSALRRLNPNVGVFCVGDDWQAINRFAGSDLKYYKDFPEIFVPSSRLGIHTNRRSKITIVEVGNALMKGRGEPARAAAEDLGAAIIVDLAKFKPSSLEVALFSKSLLTPVVLRIAGKALSESKRVVLLSVKNILVDPGGGQMHLERYLALLRSKLPEPFRERLTISTAHGYKGQESDVVIILDAMERSYPLIHPNWVFARVLGESVDAIIDESRRLFYVALTRAREKVFVITEKGRASPFLDDIEKSTKLPFISWADYPPVVEKREWVTVKVSGDYDDIKTLIPTLKADSYRYRDLSRAGGGRSWDRSFRISDLTVRFLLDDPWMLEASKSEVSRVVVSFHDGTDRCFMECLFRDGRLVVSSGSTQRDFDFAALQIAMPRPALVEATGLNSEEQ
jgi:DNA helicase-4